MIKDTWFLLVNPSAGGGKAQNHIHEIEMLLIARNMAFKIDVTACPGDATNIVEKAILDGYRKFIVAGGDGTLNEVANGILTQKVVSSTQITLAQLPLGTGNDWRRTYGIPDKLADCIDIIKGGKTNIQDAGLIRYSKDGQIHKKYFINVAGCGFDAHVTADANRKKLRGKSGMLTYIGSLISSINTYKEPKVSVEIDGKKNELDLFTLLAGICKYAGNKMKLVPHAIPNDGLLQTIMVRKISRLKIIFNIARLFNGSFTKLVEVESGSCKKIKVESNSPLLLQVDGESIGVAPFEIEILPSCLCVIVA